LFCAASLGFTPGQLDPWARLPFGPGGGPVGQAAADEQAVAILKTCRKAMASQETLLVIERLMPARIEPIAVHRQIATMDLHMLVAPGGRERTEAEIRHLLEAAGFAWKATIPLHGSRGNSIIEAVRN